MYITTTLAHTIGSRVNTPCYEFIVCTPGITNAAVTRNRNRSLNERMGRAAVDKPPLRDEKILEQKSFVNQNPFVNSQMTPIPNFSHHFHPHRLQSSPAIPQILGSGLPSHLQTPIRNVSPPQGDIHQERRRLRNNYVDSASGRHGVESDSDDNDVESGSSGGISMFDGDDVERPDRRGSNTDGRQAPQRVRPHRNQRVQAPQRREADGDLNPNSNLNRGSNAPRQGHHREGNTGMLQNANRDIVGDREQNRAQNRRSSQIEQNRNSHRANSPHQSPRVSFLGHELQQLLARQSHSVPSTGGGGSGGGVFGVRRVEGELDNLDMLMDEQMNDQRNNRMNNQRDNQINNQRDNQILNGEDSEFLNDFDYSGDHEDEHGYSNSDDANFVDEQMQERRRAIPLLDLNQVLNGANNQVNNHNQVLINQQNLNHLQPSSVDHQVQNRNLPNPNLQNSSAQHSMIQLNRNGGFLGGNYSHMLNHDFQPLNLLERLNDQNFLVEENQNVDEDLLDDSNQISNQIEMHSDSRGVQSIEGMGPLHNLRVPVIEGLPWMFENAMNRGGGERAEPSM
jgi:hypothetical protein